ncbi:MAG: creatininase family protein [Planctomycetes bacterium]|nr:creatininase family protein [Planctomycetota bacterium]
MLINLADLTSPESGARIPGSILILPAGSIEPHGPHLPLGTDTILSVETSRRAAAKLQQSGTRAFVAPPLPFAVTDFARGFPGRASITKKAAAEFAGAVLDALASAGPARILIVTLHLEPEHLQSLRDAAAASESRTGVPSRLVEFTKRRAAERIGGEYATGSCHAGNFESSLVMAAGPGLVREELRRALPALFIALPEKMKQGAATFKECGMDDAYCGDPASASAAEGERIYDILSSLVAEAAAGDPHGANK